MSIELGKDEIKIALILDDYKVPNKDDWWTKSLARAPQIERDYDFVREEMAAGITKGTTTIFRYYKPKKKEENDGN